MLPNGGSSCSGLFLWRLCKSPNLKLILYSKKVTPPQCGKNPQIPSSATFAAWFQSWPCCTALHFVMPEKESLAILVTCSNIETLHRKNAQLKSRFPKILIQNPTTVGRYPVLLPLVNCWNSMIKLGHGYSPYQLVQDSVHQLSNYDLRFKPYPEHGTHGYLWYIPLTILNKSSLWICDESTSLFAYMLFQFQNCTTTSIRYSTHSPTLPNSQAVPNYIDIPCTRPCHERMDPLVSM